MKEDVSLVVETIIKRPNSKSESIKKLVVSDNYLAVLVEIVTDSEYGDQ